MSQAGLARISSGSLPPQVPIQFTGNSGIAIPALGNLNVITANTTVKFVGSGSTLTEDFDLTNLLLGNSGSSITSATINVGLGQLALRSLTSGNGNVAVGWGAGASIAAGINNTFLGTTAGSNAGVGAQANNNTAVGSGALQVLQGASNGNTAVGKGAAAGLLNGSLNVIVGLSAGNSYLGSETNNILLSTGGVLGESNTIRIGNVPVSATQHTRAFIAGVTGVTVATSAPIAIDANGQLSSLGLGSTGQVLTSNGVGGSPTWQAGGGGGVTSVTGTANRITSTGGTTPVIDISAAYVGQTSITTLGTISTGVWNATTIAVTKGGTGLTTVAQGDLLYASAADTLSALTVTARPGFGLISNGTIPRWFNPQTDIFLVDDFVASQNNQFGNTNYTSNTQNAAGITRTGAINHPGIMQLTTQSATNGAVGLSRGNVIICGTGRMLLNFLAKIDNLSDGTDTYTLRVGFGNDGTSTADFTDGAYFEYTNAVNSGNWQIKTANNSTRTTANTNTTVDTNWHLYTVDINDAATSVAFYIDGVQVTNSPIATNLPGNTRLFADTYRIIKSAGTNPRVFNIDLTYMWIQCNSNRF